MSNQIIGANVMASFENSSGRRIHEGSVLYDGYRDQLGFGPDTLPRIDLFGGVSVSDESALLTQLQEALAPYVQMIGGVVSLLAGNPSISAVKDLLAGFQQLVSDGAGASDIEKFERREIELRMPFPHPSGFTKVILVSEGLADRRWVLPNLRPAPGPTFATQMSGIRQRPYGDFSNSTSWMEFDLAQIAAGADWQACFANDGNQNQFFPILYWFRTGNVGVLLVVKLKFIRYDLSPEIKVVGSQPCAWDLGAPFGFVPFVREESESHQQGFTPPSRSIALNEMLVLQVTRWKDGTVSLPAHAAAMPVSALEITSESRSRRLEWPGPGSTRRWRVDMALTKPANIDDLDIISFTSEKLDGEPHAEGNAKLSQRIPGTKLEPGQRYRFTFRFNDGGLSGLPEAKRDLVLDVNAPVLAIDSVFPVSVRSGGRATVRGRFGPFDPPGEFGVGGVGMVSSVHVGDEVVPFQQGPSGDTVLLGPISRGGPIIIKLRDSSEVRSTVAVGIVGHLMTRPTITSIQPTSARPGELVTVTGSGFSRGSGDAVKMAVFFIGGVAHPVTSIGPDAVQIRVQEFTPSGFISAQLDGGIGTAVTPLRVVRVGPPV